MQKVCVQGLGYVGAAMIAAIAQVRDAAGAPVFDAVGVDLPTAHGQACIDSINAGRFPFETTDDELTQAIQRGRSTGNLRATSDFSEYANCDVVIVDIHLSVDFQSDPPKANLEEFCGAIRVLGEHVRPKTLVIIETTVPPGTTEKLVVPELRKAFQVRGLDPNDVLVAHSSERVMPGREYLKSITDIWRVYSGYTVEAADACEHFLKQIINSEKFPLTRLNRPIESETAKIMENSFRAANIAFVEEWSRFAERAGVDLGAVISAIQMRPTHRNLMRPGFGVGGYCLTKDPLMVGVGARNLLGILDLSFPFCEAAVRTNREMPRATLAMLRQTLGNLRNRWLLLLGASYRQDVSDTRHSPSSNFVVWAEAEGAIVDVQDPLVDGLEDIQREVRRDLPCPDPYDAVVFAVPHSAYRILRPQDWLRNGRPLIVDANMVLNRDQIEAFQMCGCRVKAIGRGDL